MFPPYLAKFMLFLSISFSKMKNRKKITTENIKPTKPKKEKKHHKKEIKTNELKTPTGKTKAKTKQNETKVHKNIVECYFC